MIYYTNSVNFCKKMGCSLIAPQILYFSKLIISYIFLVRYDHLIVKYFSKKYQLVKMKIIGVNDCPTLLKKRVQINPSTGYLFNNFKQVLMVGRDKYSWVILHSTKNGAILNTAPDE